MLTARSEREDTRVIRAAPHNLEAEQALLGAILVNNEAHDRVSQFLEAHHFYDPLHQQIYETAAKLIGSGKQATPITLRTFFENAEPIDANLTVPQYLGRLAANATTIINARDYGRTIYDLAIRRHLILIGEDMVNAAYDAPVDFPPKEQIEEAERRLFSLVGSGRERGSDEALGDVLHRVGCEMERAHGEGAEPTGVSYGFPSIDRAAGRMRPGELVVIAGATSMGKTAFATNVARHHRGVVHFFSHEMSADELAMRLTCEESRLAVMAANNGQLTMEERVRFHRAQDAIAHTHRHRIDSSTLTIAQLATRARRVKRMHGTTLVIVDYLQLVKGARKHENRTTEVGEVTRGLKELAIELGVPVIALSQLNRELHKRTEKRPTLADLRESGSIEQDANAVIFVHREAYYLEREKPDERSLEAMNHLAKLSNAAGKAEIIIGKNRAGPPCTIKLGFDELCGRFDELNA